VVGPKLTAAELRCATVPDGADCRWEGGEYRRFEARNRAALRNRFAEQAGKCLIQPHHSPVNFLGGYKFADAPAIDVSPMRAPAAKAGVPIIDDSLDIPGFLRRSLSDMTNLTRAKDAVACFHRDRRASPARAAQPIRRPPVRQNWFMGERASSGMSGPMTSIEEKLIGRISAQLTRAVEEAHQAYEFAPGSYTAGVLNALLSAQQLVRELASASGCHRD
jgi:hypothetical protein